MPGRNCPALPLVCATPGKRAGFKDRVLQPDEDEPIPHEQTQAGTGAAGDQTAAPQAPASRLWTWAPWLALLATVVILALAWSFLPPRDWLDRLSTWVTGLGPAGPIAFGLAYVVATLLLVPGAVMTIAGGLAFGWWSAPLVLLSATVGASLAFLISRRFIHARVERLVSKRPGARAVIDAVDDEGWKALALMRLSPVIPFNLQNYLLGVTNVRLTTFFISTLAGMVPGTLLSTYIGVLGRAAGRGETSALQWTFLAVGLAATLAVIVLISRKARRKLQAKGIGDET